MVIVCHDNGVREQRGWSEEPGSTIADVERITANYAAAGIIIYDIYIRDEAESIIADAVVVCRI